VHQILFPPAGVEPQDTYPGWVPKRPSHTVPPLEPPQPDDNKLAHKTTTIFLKVTTSPQVDILYLRACKRKSMVAVVTPRRSGAKQRTQYGPRPGNRGASGGPRVVLASLAWRQPGPRKNKPGFRGADRVEAGSLGRRSAARPARNQKDFTGSRGKCRDRNSASHARRTVPTCCPRPARNWPEWGGNEWTGAERWVGSTGSCEWKSATLLVMRSAPSGFKSLFPLCVGPRSC
jgi:hypothetical protein